MPKETGLERIIRVGGEEVGRRALCFSCVIESRLQAARGRCNRSSSALPTLNEENSPRISSRGLMKTSQGLT